MPDSRVVYNEFMQPAVFLDRDGVLIENREDYVRDWSQVVFLPKAITALQKFGSAGYKLVLVTNQSAVGRGLMSLETANEINNKLVKVVEDRGGRLDAVYMCPHAPSDNCDCRKPRQGLFLHASRDLSLDLKSSWMIGDAWSDLLAGQEAGLRGMVMVKTGRGANQLQLPKPEKLNEFIVVGDLSEALTLIRQNTSS